jgi:hypothetical protein
MEVMIRIFDTVADFRKKPEGSGNTVGDRNLKRECITLSPSLVGKGLIRVIHRMFIAGCQ